MTWLQDGGHLDTNEPQEDYRQWKKKIWPTASVRFPVSQFGHTRIKPKQHVYKLVFGYINKEEKYLVNCPEMGVSSYGKNKTSCTSNMVEVASSRGKSGIRLEKLLLACEIQWESRLYPGSKNKRVDMSDQWQ